MSGHPKIGSVVVVGIAVLALGLAGTVRAQLSPNGPEFQVNSDTLGYQYHPAVASDATGNFVVVWQSDSSNGTDSSDTSVQGQRYASSGAPIGDEFQVNSFTTSAQGRPAVASDADGNFIVVWRSYSGSVGDDSDDWSVQGQRYASSGAPIGVEFQVNSYTTSGQSYAAVASDAAGNFVVVWQSYGSAGDDSSDWSVQGQRYASSGAEIGGQFQVNSYTTNVQHSPAVASDANGNFVVAWASWGSNGTDKDFYSVQGQRYASNGDAIGDEFQVNSYTTNVQHSPAVASDATGNFVVAWKSKGSNGTDYDACSVQGQRYASNGAEIGDEFQVNSYTTGGQYAPAVASDATGNFVVAWESYGSNNSDNDGYSIQGQRYASSGTKIGDEFQVNSYTADYQIAPAIASDATGNFVVAWQSYGSAGDDSSYYSIQGQRYDALFRDGFESNDTSRWSVTSP